MDESTRAPLFSGWRGRSSRRHSPLFWAQPRVPFFSDRAPLLFVLPGTILRGETLSPLCVLGILAEICVTRRVGKSHVTGAPKSLAVNFPRKVYSMAAFPPEGVRRKQPPWFGAEPGGVCDTPLFPGPGAQERHGRQFAQFGPGGPISGRQIPGNPFNFGMTGPPGFRVGTPENPERSSNSPRPRAPWFPKYFPIGKGPRPTQGLFGSNPAPQFRAFFPQGPWWKWPTPKEPLGNSQFGFPWGIFPIGGWKEFWLPKEIGGPSPQPGRGKGP